MKNKVPVQFPNLPPRFVRREMDKIWKIYFYLDRPRTFKEIREHFSKAVSRNHTYYALNSLLYWKRIKQLEDGRFVWSQYTPLSSVIAKVILEYDYRFREGLQQKSLKGIPNLSDCHIFSEILKSKVDDIFYSTAIECGEDPKKDPKTDDFRKEFFKALGLLKRKIDADRVKTREILIQEKNTFYPKIWSYAPAGI